MKVVQAVCDISVGSASPLTQALARSVPNRRRKGHSQLVSSKRVFRNLLDCFRVALDTGVSGNFGRQCRISGAIQVGMPNSTRHAFAYVYQIGHGMRTG